MFLRIRKHATYANVAATLALVFAMSGGAYAASKYLITSTKQISPTVLKRLTGKAGPTGKPGANGANGTNGVTGKEGAQGPPGAAGANGTNGGNGTDGTSVTSKEILTSQAACGKQGGSEFTAAEGKKTYACNGSPWVAGGTLPAGSSEAGQWTYFDEKSTAGEVKQTAISFGIPLKTAPKAEFIGAKEGEKEEKESPTVAAGHCKGTVAAPVAAPGYLCVFASAVVGVSGTVGFFDTQSQESGAEVSGTNGTLVSFNAAEALVVAEGSWVVTGD